jgi:hypothetical protein
MTTTMFLQKTIRDEKKAVLLGEALESSIYGGTEQFKMVISNLRNPARAISWLCKSRSPTSIDLMHMLITSRLMSRIRVGMALQMCTEKQLQQFRSIIAAEIQNSLDLPPQIPPRALLERNGHHGS